MKTFKEFLEMTGGFLGSPTSHRNMGIDDRLKHGWAKEDQIIGLLGSFFGPENVQRPQGGQAGTADKYDKIDGYVKFPTGKTLAIQIKSRESGSDILVEVYKDYERKVAGRDMVTKAQIYVVLDPSGTNIYLIPVEKIKAAVSQMVKQWEQQQKGQGVLETPSGAIRLQRGDIPGAMKLMAYLKPDQFKGIVEGFPAKIKISKAA